MTTIYLAVDEDGTELSIDTGFAVRGKYGGNGMGFWKCHGKVNVLLGGTIEKLTGRKITWEDDPIEYKGDVK